MYFFSINVALCLGKCAILLGHFYLLESQSLLSLRIVGYVSNLSFTLVLYFKTYNYFSHHLICG